MSRRISFVLLALTTTIWGCGDDFKPTADTDSGTAGTVTVTLRKLAAR